MVFCPPTKSVILRIGQLSANRQLKAVRLLTKWFSFFVKHNAYCSSSYEDVQAVVHIVSAIYLQPQPSF